MENIKQAIILDGNKWTCRLASALVQCLNFAAIKDLRHGGNLSAHPILQEAVHLL